MIHIVHIITRVYFIYDQNEIKIEEKTFCSWQLVQQRQLDGVETRQNNKDLFQDLGLSCSPEIKHLTEHGQSTFELN